MSYNAGKYGISGHSRRPEPPRGVGPLYTDVLYPDFTDMYLRDYPERQGKKIWLDQDEVELFLDQTTSTAGNRVSFDGPLGTSVT